MEKCFIQGYNKYNGTWLEVEPRSCDYMVDVKLHFGLFGTVNRVTLRMKNKQNLIGNSNQGFHC